MPTYQYACTDSECGNRFELVQSFTDPSASECPVCGSPVRKVYGSVGVVFKGSGFYRNDSRSGGSEGKSDSGSSAKSESKAEGKSESKAESSGSSSQPTPTSDSSAAKPAAKADSSSSTAKSSAPA